MRSGFAGGFFVKQEDWIDPNSIQPSVGPHPTDAVTDKDHLRVEGATHRVQGTTQVDCVQALAAMRVPDAQGVVLGDRDDRIAGTLADTTDATGMAGQGV